MREINQRASDIAARIDAQTLGSRIEQRDVCRSRVALIKRRSFQLRDVRTENNGCVRRDLSGKRIVGLYAAFTPTAGVSD